MANGSGIAEFACWTADASAVRKQRRQSMRAMHAVKPKGLSNLSSLQVVSLCMLTAQH
jgi:hypothetical protein